MLIDRETTFIVGAGASRDYGIPTGEQLKSHVISRAEAHGQSMPNASYRSRMTGRQLAAALEGSGASSVDVFLEHQPQFGKHGRYAIAAELLPREGRALSRPRPESGDWHRWLFNALHRDGMDGLPSIFPRLVVFNYDRLFETSIACMLANLTGSTLREAWAIVNALDILHVYGKLAGDPLLNEDAKRFELPQQTPLRVMEAAAGIRLMGDDRAKDDAVLAKARSWTMGAKQLIFLGFGYDKLNLERIGIDGSTAWREGDGRTHPTTFGTAFDLRQRELETVRGLLTRRVDGIASDPMLGGLKEDCLDFLRAHIER